MPNFYPEPAPSVDPREVAFYDRLADQWWDERGKFWPLHRLNALRSEFLLLEICRHCGRDPAQPRPLKGLSAIDIGCGGGILSESMAALGAIVHGIDVVERNIRVAQRHQPDCLSTIEYETTSVEAVAARGRQYDIVLNMEVVEHVVRLPAFLEACSRLLKPDGIFFIATINRNPISWLLAIVGAEYILRWLPRGTHQWRKFVTPAELETLLARAAIRVQRRVGVRINPLTREFSLSRNLLVNYLLTASRGGEDPSLRPSRRNVGPRNT